MKKIKLIPLTLLLFALGMTACNTNKGGSGGQGSGSQQESGENPDSPIKSLVATKDSVELKRGEQVSASSYYKLTGYKALSSKEKKVTITSSNPSVVQVTGALMKALTANQSSTITVTSQADPTKSCTFEVSVKDIFFSRQYSEINAENDMSKELPEDGGIVQTLGGTSDFLIFNQEPSTSFMAKAKIAVNSVSDGELWPKFGMAFKQVDDGEVTQNFALVFLDGPMNRVADGVANWTDFGYCEIANGVYGWDSQPSLNRHKENVFIKKTGINYNEFFTLTSVVEGRNIHMFLGYGEGESAKEVYMFTLEGYADLFGAGDGRGFVPGFFQFNSVVTYKEYSYTTDATAIAAQMQGVTPRSADYDSTDHSGTIYHEE